MEANRQSRADEIVIRVAIQAGSSTDVPLDIVIDQIRESAIEVVFHLRGVRTVGKQREPFCVGSNLIAKAISEGP